MFSTQDIQELHQVLPPVASPGSLNSLPSLLLSSSGRGFVTAREALHKLEDCITQGQQRLSILELARDIDVDNGAILQLADALPDRALLNVDKSHIIAKAEGETLQQRLLEKTTDQVLHRSSFSKEFDISTESIDLLTRDVDLDAPTLHQGIPRSEYIISRKYQQALSADIQSRLDAALESGSLCELSSSALLGYPPVWYITLLLELMVETNNLGEQYYIDYDQGSVSCQPKITFLQMRDKTLNQICSGEIPCIDVEEFAQHWRKIYSSGNEARKHLETFAEIHLSGNIAISRVWIQNFAKGCVDAIQVLEYADLTPQIQENFPPHCHDEVRIMLEDIIKNTYEERTGSPLRIAGYFLLTDARIESERDVLQGSAKAHASHRWEQLKESPDSGLKFRMADIVAFIPESQPILRAVSQISVAEESAEEQYWNEIASLESQNEGDFATFWSERVQSRAGNYSKGLEGIQDEKLRDQLSELLFTYITKDLIPDTISKAQSQGLVRSRKTKKNVQRFENTSKASKDLPSILNTIANFSKKQGIAEIDAESLKKLKETQVNDMVRKMQKQSDGPTLFLTVVLVLFAKHHDGTIYATGKFSPKVLRLLKPSLSAEQYEQAEKWKDLARAGTLTRADKDSMRQFAGKAI